MDTDTLTNDELAIAARGLAEALGAELSEFERHDGIKVLMTICVLLLDANHITDEELGSILSFMKQSRATKEQKH